MAVKSADAGEIRLAGGWVDSISSNERALDSANSLRLFFRDVAFAASTTARRSFFGANNTRFL
ncbi:MAG: hypothetical protein IKN89_00315 [Oscillospiraceae bacterium]|nr:hypothetical protein [Oscillospiraceae bacterium]